MERKYETPQKIRFFFFLRRQYIIKYLKEKKLERIMSSQDSSWCKKFDVVLEIPVLRVNLSLFFFPPSPSLIRKIRG